jgi:arabinosaccharide transport system substrate-binding protein
VRGGVFPPLLRPNVIGTAPHPAPGVPGRGAKFSTHEGKPPAVYPVSMSVTVRLIILTAIALATGALVALRAGPSRAAQTIWVFSEPHARQLQTVIDLSGDRNIHLELLASRALDVRLQSLSASHLSADAPLLVEIEIGSVGKYFRGTVDDVPFLPLTARLKNSGWLDRISATRLATWSTGGEIFGVPLDMHPVALVYRKDLYDTAGVHPDEARTWQEFGEMCLKFEAFERRNGRATRAIAMLQTSSDVVQMMLQQRRVDLVDETNQVHLADERVAATVAFYAQLVAGKKRVSANPSPGPGRWAEDLARGDVAMVVAPDWTIEQLRPFAAQLNGRLAARPLPVFEPSDAATASWGGTMVAIPRACENPDAAWALLEKLYLRDQTSESPPVVSAVIGSWVSAANSTRRDPLFGEQNVDHVYATLAKQLPPRRVTPFTAMAGSTLSLVLYQTVTQVEHGDAANLQADVAKLLTKAADDLKSRIAFATLGQ